MTSRAYDFSDMPQPAAQRPFVASISARVAAGRSEYTRELA
jgi:hypothetical protein